MLTLMFQLHQLDLTNWVFAQMKNLNSFEHVRKGIQYEVKRQERLLMSGGEVEQETRRFDEPSEKLF